MDNNIFVLIIILVAGLLVVFGIKKHYDYKLKKYKIKEFNKYALKKDTNIENLSFYAIWLWFIISDKIDKKKKTIQYKSVIQEIKKNKRSKRKKGLGNKDVTSVKK